MSKISLRLHEVHRAGRHTPAISLLLAYQLHSVRCHHFLFSARGTTARYLSLFFRLARCASRLHFHGFLTQNMIRRKRRRGPGQGRALTSSLSFRCFVSRSTHASETEFNHLISSLLPIFHAGKYMSLTKDKNKTVLQTTISRKQKIKPK